MAKPSMCYQHCSSQKSKTYCSIQTTVKKVGCVPMKMSTGGKGRDHNWEIFFIFIWQHSFFVIFNCLFCFTPLHFQLLPRHGIWLLVLAKMNQLQTGQCFTQERLRIKNKLYYNIKKIFAGKPYLVTLHNQQNMNWESELFLKLVRTFQKKKFAEKVIVWKKFGKQP